MEAAIWRSRMAATIAWRICACKVCPDSAEMRNNPDQIAVSFRCGMLVLLALTLPDPPVFLAQRFVFVVQTVAPMNFSNRYDLCQ